MLMTSDGPVPVTAEDWNERWKARQQLRAVPRDAAAWDKRAATFGKADAPDAYVQRFLALADLHPGETVFDMGCGAGALAIPLAQLGHHVQAVDFSRAMLDKLQEGLDESAAANIETRQLGWDDDWAAAGIQPGSFDVCLASRSLATEDLHAALMKLAAVARRRVCITFATGASPRIDDHVMRRLGIRLPQNADAVYALAMLSDEGYLPQLACISTQRSYRFSTLDEAHAYFADMMDRALDHAIDAPSRADARLRLHAWLEEDALHQGDAVVLRHPRQTDWAFLWWDVCQECQVS